MNGCDPVSLSRYLDQELAPAEAGRVTAHLAACPACRDAYRSLRDLDAVCRDALPHVEFRTPVVKARPGRVVKPLLAAAAALLVCTGVAFSAVYWTYGDAGSDHTTAPRPADTGGSASDASSGRETPTGTVPADLTATGTTPASAPTVASGSRGHGQANGPGAPLFHGTVTDTDGRPLAGARVVASTWAASSSERVAVASATTDADGVFRMPRPARADLLHIAAPGSLTGTYRVEGLPVAGDAELRIALWRPHTVSGRVVDTEGKPVRGARVAPLFPDFTGWKGAAVASDAGGAFAVATPSRGTAVVEHPDFAPALVSGTEATVTLARGGDLRVRVTRDRQAVVGAEVRLSGSGTLPSPVLARTDGQGDALFTGLPPATDYEVSLPNAEAWILKGRTRVEVRPGVEQLCSLEIDTQAPGTVRGRVLDPEGGPVAGVRLMLIRADLPTDIRAVVTGEDGRYQAALPYGTTLLSVDAYRLRAVRPDLRPTALDSRELDVRTQSQGFAEDFRLKPRQTAVRLRLLAADGSPLSRATLFAQGVLEPAEGQGFVEVETRQGLVEIDATTNGVWAYDPDTNRIGMLGIPSPEEQSETLELRVDRPAGRIVGTVVDPQGHPIPGVEVWAHPDRSSEPGFRYTLRAQTDSSGRFDLGPFVAGHGRRLYFDGPGFEEMPGRVPQGAVPAAQPPQLEVVLAPLAARITGRVVRTDGGPVAGVGVYAEAGETVRYAEVTDPGGRFSLAVTPGPYEVSARTTGGSSPPALITAPAHDLVLTLAAGQPDAALPNEEQEARGNDMKQLGLVFKMFAIEHDGDFPMLSKTFGLFQPELARIYPEYLADSLILNRLAGQDDIKLCYTGYALTTEEAAMAFLDAYEAWGPESVRGEVIPLVDEAGESSSLPLRPLKEGVERFFITDIHDPTAGARAQSSIPVLWEMPEAGAESVWVLFMDGHIEWRPYPGEFPLSEAFVERLRTLSAGH